MAAAAVLPAVLYLPVVAFGTSYCPPDGPDPLDVWLLRGAWALVGVLPAAPIAVAAAVDIRRGAPDAARRKLFVSVALVSLGVLAAAGARPSTWCF